MNEIFTTRYANLNSAQKQAVDHIEGPVMVVAGPGTGKTELLSMRAANILRRTDAAPENILCLTFTDSGSVAMQKRLRDIVGADAYKVSIYTFHAFCSEIMSRYREYFYQGADFTNADDLKRHEIITAILDERNYDDPLRGKMNGIYTSISDISSAISDLKRAGLTPAEFKALLESMDSSLEQAAPLIRDMFAGRISKSTADTIAHALPQLQQIEELRPQPTLGTFIDTLTRSLQAALAESVNHPKVTPPITAWKKQWIASDANRQPILKAAAAQRKLRSLAHVYEQYLAHMQAESLMDFDDMIMQVVQAVETIPELRYELQEKYLYLMVDEFQDTNLAQMRILHALTDNPVLEDMPNILVVGDDDQAIYSFQGAEVGNILTFAEKYPRTTRISLTDNYRSVPSVLTNARGVITQAGERLEDRYDDVTKTLTPHRTSPQEHVELAEFETPNAERTWIASQINSLIKSGTAPQEIAIIAHRHKDLVSLLGYLSEREIPINYNRRDNVLDDEAVRQLEQVARVVVALSHSELADANALLPELLSHPAWHIAPETLWEISLSASQSHGSWLESMRTHADTKLIWVWLQAVAATVPHLPLERVIDHLLGNTSPTEEYSSPFKSYFFPADATTAANASYILHLENLTTIRNALREHVATKEAPRLGDFITFVTQCRDTDTTITSLRHVGEESGAVQLLSAHGSKGLEFDHVFVVNATDAMWGEKARGRSASIVFPPHTPLARTTGSYNERLRLFYVAMTRARQALYLSYAVENDSAKETLVAGFLSDTELESHRIKLGADDRSALEAAEHVWYEPVVTIPQTSMQNYLAPVLAQYKISATHVNAFIDVTHGGPQAFLLGNLLHFPSASTPSADYGTAVHNALQFAHDAYRAHRSKPTPDEIIQKFQQELGSKPLTPQEMQTFLQKGSDALQAFLAAEYDNFSPDQQAELNFKHQEVRLGDAKLTGKLDVVLFDKEAYTARVTDYKTGGALTSWEKGSDWQKIKAHKYRQQLLFYKLLIEHSREWNSYTMTHAALQFVEPDKSGNITALELSDIDPEELARFERLIGVVWQHIQDLNFPDTSEYGDTLADVQRFEEDLLNEAI